MKELDKNNQLKLIAFYLPQFHQIPENDIWWGKGFTEWTNVKRAYPLYPEHYQPHKPGELGYYNLIEDETIQIKQIEMARKYGIYGFCYYYYWFNGKRLLEKPLNKMLENKDINFPFCICWANENWTRRWDGHDNDILIKQDYEKNYDEKFIHEIIPILYDPRYIKINGAPLLLIYRADLIPDFEKTILKWREICLTNGINKIHISCTHTSLFTNPDSVGADSVYEFPPHKLQESKDNIGIVKNISPDFKGKIFDYRTCVANAIINNHKENYTLFSGVMTGWDNTARRLNESTIFINSSPDEYKKWLTALVKVASQKPLEEQIIFINAWNEWAEGAHLEPCEKYENAYLQATKDALTINA